MSNLDKYCLYFHRNSSTLNVFYVGIGLRQRPYNTIRRSFFWKKYVNKYGLPIIEIVHNNLTQEEAWCKEIEYIKLFGRIDMRQGGTLVNMTDGGDGVRGYKVTEENKKKLRDLRLGKPCSPTLVASLKEYYKTHSGWNKGGTISEEQKQILSRVHKGKTISESHKQAVRQAHLGRKHSEETIKKLREAKKGYRPCEKARINLVLATKGSKSSLETRKKQSESRKRFIASTPDYRHIISEQGRRSISEKAKLRIGSKNSNARKVINIKTLEVYGSGIDVANKLGLNDTTFRRYMKKGKIDYKYLKNYTL